MTEYICNKLCAVTSCPRHPVKSLEFIATDVTVKMVHLEGNPMFCKKITWHGNQVEVGDDIHN